MTLARPLEWTAFLTALTAPLTRLTLVVSLVDGHPPLPDAPFPLPPPTTWTTQRQPLGLCSSETLTTSGLSTHPGRFGLQVRGGLTLPVSGTHTSGQVAKQVLFLSS